MENILYQLFTRYEKLAHLNEPIRRAAEMMVTTYQNGGKILIYIDTTL